MLTDSEIKNLVKTKKIIIKPFDEKNIRPGKYIVHLGRFLLIPKKSNEIYDLAEPDMQPQYIKKDLEQESFVLMPGQFILGQTNESVGLQADIGILLDGSTTLARLGISIHQSSMLIPSGQDPHVITLEIFNAGPWKVKLTYGIQVAKLVVFRYAKKNKVRSQKANGYFGRNEVTPAILRKGNE